MAEPALRPDSEFARYRARKREGGRRLLRLWVLDIDAPGMREEIARQVALLRDAPEEEDVLDWIEAIQAADGWPE